MADDVAINATKSEENDDKKEPSRTMPNKIKAAPRTSVSFYNSESSSSVSEAKIEEIREKVLKEMNLKSDEEERSVKFESAFIRNVFNFCVGSDFNLDTNYVISEPFNVLVLLKSLDFISDKNQLFVLHSLQLMLKKSIQNLQSCTKVGLISKFLHQLPSLYDGEVADKTIELIGVLATYSITVKELKSFFSALQRTSDMQWPPHAHKLLEILRKMPEKHGPDVYFNFSGIPGGFITVPPISKWPHQPGFTFVTWLQLDASHLSPHHQKNRPHLYSFVNTDGFGYMAHFSGPMFVIEVIGKKGKKQTILVKTKFEPQMWYHICVSHIYNRFKSSLVQVFVNGQMVTSGDVTMSSSKEPIDKCFVGGSHIQTTQHVFKGQMSAVYLIAEPLAYNLVIALYRLGPGYKGSFKFANELESMLPETDRKLVYESKLAHNVLFSYNPKAVDGDLCLEASPSENFSCFYQSPHALMNEGVQAVVTHSLQTAMHSLGGIQMLFPLFTQLDCPLYGKSEPDPTICSLLLGLIYDLLRGSYVFQQQLLQSQGFMIIGHLLQKSSAIHLTEATVDILLGLARYFMATSTSVALLGGLLDHVLLEPSLWIKTPLYLQSNLLSLFATGYVGGLDYAGYIRKEVGVSRLILMLRKYYSVKMVTENVDNPTTVEEVISLRSFVLLLVKQMIIKGQGITDDELKSILVYLAVEEEEENYMDIVQLLLSVLCEMPSSIVQKFDEIEGFQVFFKLLVATNEQVRIYSIKILCAYLQQLTVQRKLQLVEMYSFISKIGQKLLIFDLTMSTYNALFELLIARPTKIISDKRHPFPDASSTMYHPTVLPIIVSLLLKGRKEAMEDSNETLSKEISELTVVFLSDLTLLLNSNSDNKRLLLQLMCWQEWLFSMAYFVPETKDEVKITDSVFSIMKMLLYYAIQSEKEGWRVWVDTLSILHSKVSERMKEHNCSSPPTDVKKEGTSESSPSGTPTNNIPLKTKVDSTPPLSPDSNDLRKLFFQKLLKGTGSTVITDGMDGLRKARSTNNILDDSEAKDDNRPRSASPTMSRVPIDNPGNDEEIMEENNSESVEMNNKETKETTEEMKETTERYNDETKEATEGYNDEATERYNDETTCIDDDKEEEKLHLDLIKELSISGESTTSPGSPVKPKCRPYVDIPEFSWSNIHQRLLTELLFSIEIDLQVWKTHPRKSISDFVSLRENSLYIMNLCHMVSILSDSLIFCCGGLLPLVSSATSVNFANDVLEACGGMTLDSGFSFLNRILNIVDIVAFASTTNFASVETHRNMLPGGVLRQCIRLVFCGGARNRVVCRQRERPMGSATHIYPKTMKETQAAIQTLIASTKPPTEEDAVQNIPGHMTTITSPERLLQDSDIHRLRVLVYREVEDSRQARYISLVIVYFVAVLMVARYRDILEQEDNMTPHSTDPNKPPVLTIDQKIDLTFSTSAQLLREILFDYAHYFSKVLVGSRGQDLISDGLGSLKSEESTVEMVMLLCSQEWQNALQRQAGPAFMELIDEGRRLSHLTRERIVITGSEARDILNERDNFENLKHAQFESACTKTVITYIEQYRLYDQFFKAKKKRNVTTATQCLEKIFDVLTSEFGAWPMSQTEKQYYKLDRWEDVHRMRKRMVKNQYGTCHPEATLRPGCVDDIPPEKPSPLKYHQFTKRLPSSNVPVEEEEADVPDLETIDEKQTPHQYGAIIYTVNCDVISPGALLPGTLVLTRDSLYFTVDEESDTMKKIDQQILLYNDCLNIKCSFVNIVAVFSRRYILQNRAMEIFLANRRSFMFAFDNHDTVKHVIQQLPNVGVGCAYGLSRTRSVSLLSPKQMFAKSKMCQRWQNREISNFDYLMFLNTISGRTYNDLNQYFIFPWILKDYDSEVLNLNDHSVYRDLAKPIGALNPFRLGQFVERFNSWDESSEIPAFHYGTHYSTGSFVMNWLVRLEPFASLFLSLQSGKFDHPSRTFASIKNAWENCQRDTSDVKELIPELFYFPQMFRNNNNFIFGEVEPGKSINNVDLPVWAESPEHFIHLHREALESEYVSENLHKWIDLIFGYKQKGKEAEHNANVFYYLTYEGSVDIESVTEPVAREGLEQQIKSFGQTPSQLLTTPHPPRVIEKDKNQEPHKSIFLSFVVTPEVPVTHVTAYTNAVLPSIITISCNQMFSINKWINFGGSITSFQSLKNVQIEQDPNLETMSGRSQRQLGEPLDENVTVTSSCFTVTSDNRFILTCGYWDKSFKCFSTESGKLIQCVFGHRDVVTCLAYCDDLLTSTNAIVVSGSADATVLVWIWDHNRHQIIGPDDGSGHGSTPIAICTGHELQITCVNINTSVGVIASGSLEGACLVHSLSGDLLRSLKGPSPCLHPRLVNISNEGQILVNYSEDTSYMAMFTSNGELLNSVKLDEMIMAVVFTNDGRFFVTGGFNRCFKVWRTHELVLLTVFPSCDGSIRSLALTPDQRCLVAGLSTGSIIAMAMDFSMWPRVCLLRNQERQSAEQKCVNEPVQSVQPKIDDENSDGNKDGGETSTAEEKTQTSVIVGPVPEEGCSPPTLLQTAKEVC